MLEAEKVGCAGACGAARSRRTSEVAAHGTNGGWSVGERFFRPAGLPAEEVGGPSTARRPSLPTTAFPIVPQPARRSAQDDKIWKWQPDGGKVHDTL